MVRALLSSPESDSDLTIVPFSADACLVPPVRMRGRKRSMVG